MNISTIQRCGGIAATMILCAVLSGCQSPEGMGDTLGGAAAQDVARVPTEPNVVNVVTIYNSISPWIYDRDRTKVRGIYISGLYLLGPTGHGVFGDGVIRPRLFVVDRGPDSKRHPEMVKEWSFTVEEAIPFRGKQKRTPGWGYGLPLVFDNLDLAGREVQVILEFERNDGRIVQGSKQTFLVPKLAE